MFLILLRFISNFKKDDSASTAIEYGLIAALISVIIVAGLTLVGFDLDNIINIDGSDVGNDDIGKTGGATSDPDLAKEKYPFLSKFF